MQEFENKLSKDLHQYLIALGKVDERMPECPDVEEKWEPIAQSYLVDGIREFADYPTVSLGWMMYIGMAVAKYWDSEWEIYSKIDDLYAYIRDKRGYDCLDEYVVECLVGYPLEAHAAKKLESTIRKCANAAHTMIRKEGIEPQSVMAFHLFARVAKVFYRLGVSLELRHRGYKYVKMNVNFAGEAPVS